MWDIITFLLIGWLVLIPVLFLSPANLGAVSDNELLFFGGFGPQNSSEEDEDEEDEDEEEDDGQTANFQWFNDVYILNTGTSQIPSYPILHPSFNSIISTINSIILYIDLFTSPPPFPFFLHQINGHGSIKRKYQEKPPAPARRLEW